MSMASTKSTGTLEKLPKLGTPLHHVHHAAYRCRDAEQTRWFWEEVLGFELKIALAFDKDPATGQPYEYMHLFFQMGDDNFVAFFDAPDDAEEAMFEPKGGYDLHVAFECSGMDELKAWEERVNAMGVPCGPAIDHGFVRSLYMYDPNGLQVEITAKTPAYDDIVAREHGQVNDVLERWSEQSRSTKIRKFGADKIQARGALCRENLEKIVEEMMNNGNTF
jgi:catechol 2,3-dioxygenase-like lactoylglutathione lyase family enzyme